MANIILTKYFMDQLYVCMHVVLICYDMTECIVIRLESSLNLNGNWFSSSVLAPNINRKQSEEAKV